MEEYSVHHLHCNRGSVRDGVSSIKEIVEKHKENNFKSVCLTDHDSMCGQRELFELCEKENLKPIIGIEFYMILNQYKNIKEKEKLYISGLKERGDYYHDAKSFHITCVCKNETGYQNLLKLKYLSALKPEDNIKIDGFEGTYYKKGRVTEKQIFHFSEGLIFTSGCRLSIFNEYLQVNNIEKATTLLHTFNNNCETFMIELHPANNEVEETLFHWLKIFAFKNNIPCLIANDSHYVSKGDLYKWNVLGAGRRNKTIISGKDDIIQNDDFYIKSFMEMWKRVKQLNNGNVQDTMKCFAGHTLLANDINFKWINRKAPKFHIDNADKILWQKLQDGLERRFNSKVPQEYLDRLDKEFAVAKITDNCSYYLLVDGIIQYAKGKHQLPPGRGSAASLLILYLLNVTKVDPILYGLVAERASNAQRITMLDVDLDFSRSAVTDIFENYLKPTYGNDSIVNVANYGFMKLSSSLRASMKFLETPEHVKNKISKAVKAKFIEIQYMGDEEIEISPYIKSIEKEPDFIKIFEKNGAENYEEIFKYAKALESTYDKVSVHASANIITNLKSFEQFPCRRVKDTIVCELDKDDISSSMLDYLKVDLLRVSTIGKIENTIKNYNADWNGETRIYKNEEIEEINNDMEVEVEF